MEDKDDYKSNDELMPVVPQPDGKNVRMLPKTSSGRLRWKPKKFLLSIVFLGIPVRRYFVLGIPNSIWYFLLVWSVESLCNQ